MLALIASPALAERDYRTRQMQEEQVSTFLATLFQKDPANQVWHWERMVEVCTRDLVYLNPEQDPESSGIRLTPKSQMFLIYCGEMKGFKSLPAPIAPPAQPLTYTMSMRMEVVEKVLSRWVSDTSRSGLSTERRNRECAEWIGTQAEWKAMLNKEPEWRPLLAKGEGPTAQVTVLLVACAEIKGFEMREEMKGAPLKALNDAARIEREAAKQ